MCLSAPNVSCRMCFNLLWCAMLLLLSVLLPWVLLLVMASPHEHVLWLLRPFWQLAA